MAAMQVSVLRLMLSRHELPANILIDLAVSLLPLAAGTMLGILMFRRINEAAFRRIILIMLPISGLSFAL